MLSRDLEGARSAFAGEPDPDASRLAHLASSQGANEDGHANVSDLYWCEGEMCGV